MPTRGTLPTLLTFVLGLSITACSGYRDQLDRADVHYRAAEYEAALSNLEDLDGDWARLDPPERLRYEYIRGMTAARLSQRVDARHWLAIAREELASNPHVLTEEMQGLLNRTLAEMDPVSDPNFRVDALGNQPRAAGATGAPGSAAHP